MHEMSKVLTTAEAQRLIRDAAIATGLLAGPIEFFTERGQGITDPELRALPVKFTVKGTTPEEILANLEAVGRAFDAIDGVGLSQEIAQRSSPDSPMCTVKVSYFAKNTGKP